MRMFAVTLGTVLLIVGSANGATAQVSDDVIRIGVLTDQSGLAADIAGRGSVEAAKMAAAQFGDAIGGKRIEIIDADSQNKPDIGSAIARRWLTQEKVDVIVDVPASSVALAVQSVAREANKPVLFSSAAADAITGKECAPLTAMWTYNGYALGKVVATAVIEEGGDSWFFVTSDYAGGVALENGARSIVQASGAKVLGSVRHPFNNSDFSSFLLQAQASNAKVIALASAGNDMINAIKQAQEFNISTKQRVVSLMLFLSDIHGLGLKASQNLLIPTAFYWNGNARAREWSMEFYKRFGKMPTDVQAGVGSAVRHYLQAIKDTGTDDGATVIATMKKTPVNDFFAQNGVLREDGQMIHDMYLARIKTPDASKEPWDYLDIIQTIPGKDAFRPLSESQCPLINGTSR
jgi:branched-chain amino acid transport system substrate-binding protein